MSEGGIRATGDRPRRRFGAASLRGCSNSAFFEVEPSHVRARFSPVHSRVSGGASMRCVSSRRGVRSLLTDRMTGGIMACCSEQSECRSCQHIWRERSICQWKNTCRWFSHDMGRGCISLARCGADRTLAPSGVRFRRDLRGGRSKCPRSLRCAGAEEPTPARFDFGRCVLGAPRARLAGFSGRLGGRAPVIPSRALRCAWRNGGWVCCWGPGRSRRGHTVRPTVSTLTYALGGLRVPEGCGCGSATHLFGGRACMSTVF